MRCSEQHYHVKYQNHRIGHSGISPRIVLHALLIRGKSIASLIHLCGTPFPLPELYNLVKTAKALKHETAQLTRHGTEPHSVIPAQSAHGKWDNYSYQKICAQSNQAEYRLIASNNQAHYDCKEKCNAYRRNRVSVEHLKKLDIRCDNRNQITSVLTLKLRRT